MVAGGEDVAGRVGRGTAWMGGEWYQSDTARPHLDKYCIIMILRLITRLLYHVPLRTGPYMTHGR